MKPPLDSNFILLASRALKSECNAFESFETELRRARSAIDSIAFGSRVRLDLPRAAWDYARTHDADRIREDAAFVRRIRDGETALDFVNCLRVDAHWTGLYVGLVAGHLLTNTETSRGGAR